MEQVALTLPKRSTIRAMKTYTFKVIVEPDEKRWHAYCPLLEQ